MKEIEVAIVGAGVAGLAAATYSARAGRDTTVLEALAPGGQCMFIDKLENYPGLTEPVSAFTLAERFEKQATGFGAKIAFNSVKKIEKKENRFIITCTSETYSAKAVIWAAGAQHRHLNCPGEQEYDGRGVSYCATCDGPLFKDKKILVVGGGDSALTDALYLSKLSGDVTLIHRKQNFRAQQILIDRVANSSIKTVMQTTLSRITGDGQKVTGVELKNTETGETTTEAFDAVFIFVGMLPRTEILDPSLLDRSGYLVTNEKMESGLKGLYGAGDVRNTPFRQIVTAASDGAVAAHFANSYIDEIEGNEYK